MRTPSYQFCCLIQLYPNKLSGFPQIATLWGTCCSVFQSCPTLCDTMDCSMPGSSVFHYLPKFAQDAYPLSQWCYLIISSSAALFSFYFQFFRTPGFFPTSRLFHQVPCCCCFSHVRLCATLWTAARQAPLSMVFSRQELLEWVAVFSSRASSRPRDWTHIS